MVWTAFEATSAAPARSRSSGSERGCGSIGRAKSSRSPTIESSRTASSPTISSSISASAPLWVRIFFSDESELKITASGFRTSWAITAASSPRAASRSRSSSSPCSRFSSFTRSRSLSYIRAFATAAARWLPIAFARSTSSGPKWRGRVSSRVSTPTGPCANSGMPSAEPKPNLSAVRIEARGSAARSSDATGRPSRSAVAAIDGSSSPRDSPSSPRPFEFVAPKVSRWPDGSRRRITTTGTSASDEIQSTAASTSGSSSRCCENQAASAFSAESSWTRRRSSSNRFASSIAIATWAAQASNSASSSRSNGRAVVRITPSVPTRRSRATSGVAIPTCEPSSAATFAERGGNVARSKVTVSIRDAATPGMLVSSSGRSPPSRSRLRSCGSSCPSRPAIFRRPPSARWSIAPSTANAWGSCSRIRSTTAASSSERPRASSWRKESTEIRRSASA